ncbi:SAV_2336 N-terminal domain-related protein [Streptomyces olivaceus]|uniref:SAV_2336 N-terminal domain-related protein n=1 Tax=Streptomyces olivaceus TaxID=47716 RepID=UPI0021E111CA|nr:SAV_2336 N-terminal domain-related protein [Streptomyces olivaceus]
MFDRLTTLLSGAGVDLSTEELLDVLWVATVRQAGEPEEGAGSEQPTKAVRTPVPEAEEPESPDERSHDRGSPLPEAPADRLEPVRPPGLYAPAGPGAGGGGSARAVGVHGTRSLASPRALSRVMRPLRRTVPSRTALAFDEAATVEWMAETALHEPVLRPEPERWLNAALVVDDGPSMVLWQQYAAEVRALLEGLGAFRDIRTYWLDSSGEPGPLVKTRPLRSGSVSGAGLRIDPARPTVIMVLSDMVGPGWSNGTVKELLRGWARRAPVAVLQTLPERMWPSADRPDERLVVQSREPAAAGRTLRVSHPVLPSELVSYRGTPVPVLELTKSRLGPWISLLSTGHSRAGLSVLLIPDGVADTGSLAGSRAGTGAADAPEPAERIRRFREAASPESRQLAGAMASVKPLTLPVMRLVHEVSRAGGGQHHPAQLAEVFLGGLLRRVGTAERTRAADSLEYEFVPGVAELLLDTVRTSVALDTAAQVSEYLLRRGGFGPEFRARLAGEGAGAVPDPPEEAGPFAAASPQLLRRLGLWEGPAPAPTPQPSSRPDPESGAERTQAPLPEVPEDPAEVFVMERVAPALVDFARRLTDDPALPSLVGEQAQRIVEQAQEWRAGYGWEGVTAMSLLGDRLVAAREQGYRAELGALLRQLLAELAAQTDLVSRNTRGHLAIALSGLGETDEGVAHLREVIAVSSDVHGADHAYTLNARQHMQEMFFDAGRLPEAEAEGQALLAALERTEADAEQRSQAVRYQAYTLHLMQRHREAETLLRSLVALEAGPLERSMDARLISRSWLAGTLGYQGRYVEAESELRSGLEELEQSGELKGWGEALTLDNLADLLDDCGRHEEAEPLRRATLAASERWYGPGHPATYRARRDLVSTLRMVDRFAEARDEAESVEPQLDMDLGELHNETLRFRALRALIHADLAEYDEAVALQRRVLAHTADLEGAVHRSTLTFRHDLGNILRKAGRFVEAKEILRAVLAEECEHLGVEDSLTNATRYALASVLDSVDRTDEAIAVCRELLAIEERILPGNSPETAKTRFRLAGFLAKNGAHEEAADHLGKAWTVRCQVTRLDAAESMSTGHAYGTALLKADRPREALDVMEAVIEARSRVLGVAHPATLASRLRHGDVLAALGRWARARKEWTTVRETAADELGEEHEIVRTALQSLQREAKAPGR